jgi:hypothetical protein
MSNSKRVIKDTIKVALVIYTLAQDQKCIGELVIMRWYSHDAHGMVQRDM